MMERKRKRGGEGTDAEAGEGGAAQGPAAGEAAAEGQARPSKAAKQRQGGGGGGGGGTQQPKQQQQQQQRGKGDAGGAAEGQEAGGVKVLRTYGQRRPKADPVTDAAAPTLSKGLLQLIAGKKGRGGGGGSGGAD